MSDDRSFFVDSRGESSISTATAPALGHVRHTCHDCGAPWKLGQASCPKCNGIVFTETYVPGTLLERIGDKIRGVATPEKPKAPRASAALVSEARGLVATIAHCRAELARIDDLYSAAVRDDGIDELLPAHSVLHAATFITGERSSQNIKGLSLGLESFVACLDAEIKNLEDNPT